MPPAAFKPYPRPPIVEAMVAFHFVEKDEQALAKLESNAALKDIFGGDIEDHAGQSGPRFLKSADGLRVLSRTLVGFGVHVLKPYPGWSNFLGLTKAVADSLSQGLRSDSVSRLSLRYVNRLMFPDVVDDLGQYITILPPRPVSMPDSLKEYALDVESGDPAEGYSCRLKMRLEPNSEADEKKRAQMLLDIGVTMRLEVNVALSSRAWLPVLEDLHRRHRMIFEESITDTTRKLFL